MAPTDSVRGLLARLLGPRSADFTIELIRHPNDFDSCEIEARGGRVWVRGSSQVAICRGVYHYLREACRVQVSWSSVPLPLSLPESLPELEIQKVATGHRHRYYLSVCTFGYSTPWWTWERWEQEIDWMVLHGINMPLALCGQELIWQRVFRELGLDESAIRAHFSGPAYLPWHRLGNLNGHLGPLPQSWIDGQGALQNKILSRMRELGMTPVVPGFSGFVPAEFGSIRPDVPLHSATAWAGFPATTYVDPRHPAFSEIGGAFMREYRKEFGEAHHYLCETFAEQNPQFPTGSELEELAALGRASWETLVENDPEATWVMQGWPFYYAKDYWSPQRTAALFSAVPDDRLIVLDLATEELEIWREQPTVRAKGWLHCVVHNYGQNTPLTGDLCGFARRAFDATHDSDHGNMLGMGIVPEGIDQNPVVYELLTDLMWRSDRVDVGSWLAGYAHSRYGRAPVGPSAAWSLLLESVYGPAAPPTLGYCWRYRPGDQPLVSSVDLSLISEAAVLLFGEAESLGHGDLYQRDLVDVVKTWLGGLADQALNAALEGSGQTREDHKIRFFGLLEDLDRLMATRPEHRLSTWIASARGMGADPAEADLFERNARSLLTVWGGPVLFDYATREWAGLIKDFHLPRWRLFFDGSGNIPAWEAGWAASTRLPEESAAELLLELVGELIEKYQGAVDLPPPGLVHRYGPMAAVSGVVQIDFGSLRAVSGVAVFPIFGQGCRARYSIEVSLDGLVWRQVSGLSAARYRGTRQRFEASECRYVRVRVSEASGGSDQLFQVVVFGA